MNNPHLRISERRPTESRIGERGAEESKERKENDDSDDGEGGL